MCENKQTCDIELATCLRKIVGNALAMSHRPLITLMQLPLAGRGYISSTAAATWQFSFFCYWQRTAEEEIEERKWIHVMRASSMVFYDLFLVHTNRI
jgi:hypothetical protein